MQLAIWLIERPRWFKRTVLIVNDIVMLTFALWAAYSLRLSELYVPDGLDKMLLMAVAPVIGIVVFYMRGLYKLVTRFIGPEGTTRIYVAVIIATVLWALVVLMSGVKVHPRSVIVIDGLIDSPGTRALARAQQHPEIVMNPVKIAEAFYYLHTQDKSCWTHELQLTPFPTKPSA